MSKAPMPDTVWVLGHKIEVEAYPCSPSREDGYYREGEQVIGVAMIGPDAMRETLLHEVVHACEQACALGLEEAQVHALARALYSFVQDNPVAVAWLAKG